MIHLDEIKLNQNNPRLIKDEKFKKLVRSIKDFPKMMELRPIIIDDEGIILGGNMRYQAVKELGMTTIPEKWVVRASDLTEEQKREFIIKDNVGFGEWDLEIIARDWDVDLLADFGLELPEFKQVADEDSEDYSERNNEVDVDELDADMTINLKYTSEEFFIVKEGLARIAQTPEQAVWRLLGNE